MSDAQLQKFQTEKATLEQELEALRQAEKPAAVADKVCTTLHSTAQWALPFPPLVFLCIVLWAPVLLVTLPFSFLSLPCLCSRVGA